MAPAAAINAAETSAIRSGVMRLAGPGMLSAATIPPA